MPKFAKGNNSGGGGESSPGILIIIFYQTLTQYKTGSEYQLTKFEAPSCNGFPLKRGITHQMEVVQT